MDVAEAFDIWQTLFFEVPKGNLKGKDAKPV